MFDEEKDKEDSDDVGNETSKEGNNSLLGELFSGIITGVLFFSILTSGKIRILSGIKTVTPNFDLVNVQ